MDEQQDVAAVSDDAGRLVPPPRSGSRDERRETTLRAMSAGDDACCAYCGDVLPPTPPRGGRPTPYCPADPQRYGQWGARTITCAMLDEQREIWVQVYGADQPMTQLDVHTLDERLTALAGVLDPVRDELGALQEHVTGELAAALQAKTAADDDRRAFAGQAREATAERDRATAAAAQAREEAEAARAAQASAEETAAQAISDRDEAVAAREAAQREASDARADRHNALNQVSAAQERITELQNTLASERAAAVEQLDQLRREQEHARQELRATLTEDYEQRIRAQDAEHNRRLANAQAAADQRITDLTSQLAQSTQDYAASLQPMHEQISALRDDLAARTAAATAAHQRMQDLREAVLEALHGDGQPAREPLQDALDRCSPAPAETGTGPQTAPPRTSGENTTVSPAAPGDTP